MRLKNPLCEVDADDDVMFHGCSLLLWRFEDHHLGTVRCRQKGHPRHHKHRNLLAHAPKHMHEELGNDYRDMIYADTAKEIDKRRKAFLRKWRLKGKALADSWVGEGGPWPRRVRVSHRNGIGSLPSPASIRRNGKRPERPMPSNG